MIKLSVTIDKSKAIVNYLKPDMNDELIVGELLIFAKCINEIQKEINDNLCEVFGLEMDKL